MITTAVAHLQTEGTTQIDFCMCNPPFYDIGKLHLSYTEPQ